MGPFILSGEDVRIPVQELPVVVTQPWTASSRQTGRRNKRQEGEKRQETAS